MPQLDVFSYNNNLSVYIAISIVYCLYRGLIFPMFWLQIQSIFNIDTTSYIVSLNKHIVIRHQFSRLDGIVLLVSFNHSFFLKLCMSWTVLNLVLLTNE